MEYPLCRHIKTNGVQCQSPALHSGLHCFFHHRLYERHSGFRHTKETRGYLVPGQHIELAPLEDRESIQVALSMIINALATGQLETRRATALFYGLSLASSNAASLDLKPYAPDVVRSVESTPDGLDLAEEGAIGFSLTSENIPDEELEREEDEDEEEDEVDRYNRTRC